MDRARTPKGHKEIKDRELFVSSVKEYTISGVMLLVVTLLVFVLAHTTEGCSCAQSTLHRKYCNSDFLIHGKVLSVTRPSSLDITADIYYTVRVLDVFKDTTNFVNSNIINIWTPGNDGICRVPLVVNKTYYLGGRANKTENRLKIILCDFWKQTKFLKSCQVERLKNNQFDCSCKEPSCFQDC